MRSPLDRTRDWRDTPLLQPEDERDVDALAATLIGTGEPWKILLAHLLEYWAREGRAHRAQHLAHARRRPRPPPRRPRRRRRSDVRALDRAGRKAAGSTRGLPLPAAGARAGAGRGRGSTDVSRRAGRRRVGRQRRRRPGDRASSPWCGATRRPRSGSFRRTMVRNDWVNTTAKSDAAREVATTVADDDTAFPAIGALLRREIPRFSSRRPPCERATGSAPTSDEIVEAAAALDRSVLAVQGPPGTGKTYTGAHDRAAPRRTTASASASPRSATMRSTTCCASACSTTRRCASCGRHGKPHDRAIPSGHVQRQPGEVGHGRPPDPRRHELDVRQRRSFGCRRRSTCSSSTKPASSGSPTPSPRWRAPDSAILLGDPLQLAQVAIASHPGGSGASALQHLLGDDATMSPERGAFLDESRRMHPAVCEYISRQIYDGRLRSHPDCARQSVGGQAGLRWIRASHTGNATSVRGGSRHRRRHDRPAGRPTVDRLARRRTPAGRRRRDGRRPVQRPGRPGPRTARRRPDVVGARGSAPSTASRDRRRRW